MLSRHEGFSQTGTRDRSDPRFKPGPHLRILTWRNSDFAGVDDVALTIAARRIYVAVGVFSERRMTWLYATVVNVDVRQIATHLDHEISCFVTAECSGVNQA